MLYFALQRPDYPRNERIRRHLAESGAEVRSVLLTPRPGYVRHLLELARASLRVRGPVDVVVLSEFSLSFAPISWITAKRLGARHVVDFFVGPYETHVEDRGVVSPFSISAFAMRAIEWFAAMSAHLLLVDTDTRGRVLARRFKKPTTTLPVGAPDWAKRPARASVQGRPRILYYGNYIPLHGVPTFLEAVHEASSELGEYKLTMVGEGDDRKRAEEIVVQRGLADRVTFLGSVGAEELGQMLANHDIVIGIFGSSRKASGVIANKVWQGLYANRFVVTRDSEALEEIRDIAAERLVVSRDAGVPSIAAALSEAVRRSETEGIDGDLSDELEAYVSHRFREIDERFFDRQAE